MIGKSQILSVVLFCNREDAFYDCIMATLVYIGINSTSSFMLRICLFVTFLVTTCLAYGQSFDLEKIRSATTDSTNQYFYAKLVAEFLAEPEYFPAEKGIYLYYGHMYSEYYKYFKYSKQAGQFDKFITNRRYKKAIEVGEKLLEQDPMALDLLLKLNVCYKFENMPDKAAEALKKAEVLLRAIKSMGDRPYIVTSVNDEYIFMAGEKLTRIERVSRTPTDSEKIPRTKVQGISSVLDSWDVKDERTNEKKTIFFEVLYNTASIKFP
jgi:tetratricopeptide (TPR) repeat protein